jgi:hypothetical protein
MPTRYPYHRRDNASPSRDFATGAPLNVLTPYEREQFERDGFLRRAVSPPYPMEYLGETPTDGEEAAERWLDLHDHAVEMRAQLRPGDIVQTKIVRRALRSVLLYEHPQGTPPRPLGAVVAHAHWSPPSVLGSGALGTMPVCPLPGHCRPGPAGGHCARQRLADAAPLLVLSAPTRNGEDHPAHDSWCYADLSPPRRAMHSCGTHRAH